MRFSLDDTSPLVEFEDDARRVLDSHDDLSLLAGGVPRAPHDLAV